MIHERNIKKSGLNGSTSTICVINAENKNAHQEKNFVLTVWNFTEKAIEDVIIQNWQKPIRHGDGNCISNTKRTVSVSDAEKKQHMAYTAMNVVSR